MRRTHFCAALLLWSSTGWGALRPVPYTAAANDTVESVAADYYGNRQAAALLSEVNGLKDPHLRAGQKIKLPSALRYRVRKGDTIEGLAARFLDDQRRAPFLATWNGVVGGKLREGQTLLVPYNVAHKTVATDTWTALAKTFLGDPSRAKQLADYNFHGPQLKPGERVIMPVARLRIRTVRLEPPPVAAATPTAAAEPPEVAQKREAELAARVGAELQHAEDDFKEGRYAAVPAGLDKLLTEEDPSEQQLADLFRLKAFAYVALGMDELAVDAFREMLARRPDATFDPALVSPKILAAVEKAKHP